MGGMTIVGSPALGANAISTINSEGFPRYADEGLTVLSEIIGRYNRVEGYILDLKIFVWEHGVGAYVRTDSSLDSPEISLIVSGSSDRALAYPGNWWSSVVSLASHELAHLNQQLLDPGAYRMSLDTEAAAEVMSACARIRFFDIIGAPSISYAFGNPEDKQAFPGLHDGVYAPEIEHLDHVPDMVERGYLLGLAAVVTFFPEERVDFSDQVALNDFYS